MFVSCDHITAHCIYETLKKIEETQSSLYEECKTSCYEFDSPLRLDYKNNTIPIMLICKGDFRYFIASGVFKTDEQMEYECFKTPVFRVSKVITDEDQCCVVLELLQPQCKNGLVPPISNGDDICDFFSSKKIKKFIRTGICVMVDLSCFCGVESLSPVDAPCGKPQSPSSQNKEKIIQEEICGNFSHGTQKVWETTPGMYIDGTFEIYNSAQSSQSIKGYITANPSITFPNVSPGTSICRSTRFPTSFTIEAPKGTSGKYCIHLTKLVSTTFQKMIVSYE